MVETSKASFSVQWSSGEYLRSQAQSRNLISCTLMLAMRRESFFVRVPRSLSLPLPLLFRPAAGDGAATAPSAVRTPQPGAPETGRTGGACATRLARSAARSSFGATGLAGPGADGAAGAGAGTGGR